MSANNLFGDDNNDDDDDVGDGKTTTVNDKTVIANITDAFGDLGIIEDQASRLVDYNGSNIDPEDAEVLNHIVDGFNDHLGRKGDPNFTFSISGFDDLGSNDTYKAKDDGPGSKFNTSVSCNYTINGNTVTSGYFAMDNIYFEAVSITTKEGVPAKNHGTSWMNIYLSRNGAQQFVGKFSQDVGWDIKASMFTPDKRQNLASLRVALDDEAPPAWTTMMIPEPDDDDQSIELRQCGSVSSIIQTPDLQGIYLGTGFFTMNYNVVTEDASVDTLEAIRDAARVGGNPMAGRVSISLVGLRVTGPANGITRVTLGKKKRNARI